MNRLSHETSPYLQQHAANPVDWYPWGPEALQRSREEDKPILLSVGYSACHWCHVMAHESFEDPEVADIMNKLFVNIKVDREERPDIDQIYQLAHQILAGRSGGWPLTMFLTPDQQPFFGGTYFPKTARYQLPGFADLLHRIASAYGVQRSEIAEQNERVGEMLRQFANAGRGQEPEAGILDAAAKELKDAFDVTYGGLGRAPKFPHPYELDFCLRYAVSRKDGSITKAVLHTLEQMALGGIYDQLGGGFCRYSVDETWAIPHFEKMLYDNGPLLALYADAYVISGTSLFRCVCEDTVAWVRREMQSPEGAFYCSLDADSEHVEGKFYVWKRDDVRALVTPEEYAVASLHFGLEGAANFEHEFWHLRVSASIENVAAQLGKPVEWVQELVYSAKAKLFAAREKRVRPGRDDKVLVSWNALMIHGLVHAARVLGRPEWIGVARQALAFIQSAMWRENRLLATYKDGRAHLNAYLDDYAFLLAALIDLIQADYQSQDVAFAVALAEVLLDQFEDREAGGFFFTSHDHERLILRPKPGYDNATPSGNGTAAIALQRLGHLLGEPRFLAAAERALRSFAGTMRQQPSGHSSLCAALDEYLTPPAMVVLRGPRDQLSGWAEALLANYRPGTLVVGLQTGLEGLPGVLNKPASAVVNAWICRGVTCLAPVGDPSSLIRSLDELG